MPVFHLTVNGRSRAADAPAEIKGQFTGAPGLPLRDKVGALHL